MIHTAYWLLVKAKGPKDKKFLTTRTVDFKTLSEARSFAYTTCMKAKKERITFLNDVMYVVKGKDEHVGTVFFSPDVSLPPIYGVNGKYSVLMRDGSLKKRN